MNKTFYKIIILLLIAIFVQNSAIADDDGWSDALDVYNSDGLDKPVSAIEYKKVLKELDDLKAKHQKKKWFWEKWKEEPTPKTPSEPVKIERSDILKITTPLYYDGVTVPVGFYKITSTKENNQYYINLLQGKTPIVRVLANQVPHTSFAPNKINAINTEIYKDNYFKINFKTIDYALSGYLTIVK
ncbi:MAG: hypothetical protein MJ180_01825 [Candidatus Gastranaerophilales bacterium]|nr:hypothetical protein [Candidatus Gastranaerophilales bacterium]